MNIANIRFHHIIYSTISKTKNNLKYKMKLFLKLKFKKRSQGHQSVSKPARQGKQQDRKKIFDQL